MYVQLSPTQRKLRSGALLSLCLAPLLTLPAKANQASTRIEATINGMVCSFCVLGIERKLRSLSATESVSVDLQRHRVNVSLRPGGEISDQQLRQAIRDAGFDVRELKRFQSTP